MAEWTARSICINPCPPSASGLGGIQIPFAGKIQAVGELSFTGGCTDCKLVSNLLLQLQPVFTGLGIPLCVLGCVGGILSVLTALKDVVTDLPVPNIVGFLQKIEELVPKCFCVVKSFTPLGVIDFLAMIRDFLSLIIGILGCVTSLMNHLVRLNLKASIRLSSQNVEIRKSGECLKGYNDSMQAQLAKKMEIFSAIFGLLGTVFTFVEAVAPLPNNVKFSNITAIFGQFNTSLSAPSASAGDLVEVLGTLVTTLTTVRDVFSTLLP